MTKLLASAAAFLTLAAATAAPALPIEPGRSTAVRYADLDLTSPEGKAVLQRRIRGAITLVCGPRGDADLRAQMARSECRTYAQAGVDRSMKALMLQRAGQVEVAALTVSGR